MDEALLPAARYPFSNDHDRSPDHHDALADLFDLASLRRINGLFPTLAGLRIADVAAGAGSLAHRLADEVAPGQVVATDINPALVREHSRLRLWAHDITTGTLPDRPFDLVHVRALCNWLPDPRGAVANMVLSLAPGGWLLSEDMVPVDVEAFVLDAPTTDDAALLRRFEAAYLGALAEQGNEQTWPGRAETVLRGLGLRDVGTTVFQTPWPGGGAGCRMLSAASAQVRTPIMRAGLSGDELDRVDRLLRNPRVVVAGHALHSVSGRLPTEG
jgi:SAM-dependent methyltransferase